jgi:hypothetical protein
MEQVIKAVKPMSSVMACITVFKMQNFVWYKLKPINQAGKNSHAPLLF